MYLSCCKLRILVITLIITELISDWYNFWKLQTCIQKVNVYEILIDIQKTDKAY